MAVSLRRPNVQLLLAPGPQRGRDRPAVLRLGVHPRADLPNPLGALGKAYGPLRAASSVHTTKQDLRSKRTPATEKSAVLGKTRSANLQAAAVCCVLARLGKPHIEGGSAGKSSMLGGQARKPDHTLIYGAARRQRPGSVPRGLPFERAGRYKGRHGRQRAIGSGSPDA